MKRTVKAAFGALFVAAALTVNISGLPVKTADTASVSYIRMYAFGDGLMGLCAYILGFMLLYKMPTGKKHLVGPAICAFLFTASGIFAGGNTDLSAFHAKAALALLGFVFAGSFILFACLTKYVDSLMASEDREKNKCKTWLYALIILVSWLPYLLIAFPGTLHNDSYDQIGQVVGTFSGEEVFCRTALVSTFSKEGVLINDTQPVLHTLFVGGLYMLMRLMGRAELSVFAAGCIQIMFGSIVCARSVSLIGRMGAKKGVRCVMIAFYALFPMIPMYVSSTMKDACFALCLLWYLTFVLEYIRFPQTANLAVGAIAALLTAFTRSFGIWLVLVTVPALLISARGGNLKKICVCVMIPVVSYFAVTYAVFPLAGIGKGPESESMSVMFQQTALYVKEYGEEVTDEEKNTIDRALGYDDLAERYNPKNADSVKFGALERREGLSEYKKTWLEMFGKKPSVYARAFAAMSADYWDIRQHAVEGDFKVGLGTHGNDQAEFIAFRTNKKLLELCDTAIAFIRMFGALPGVSVLFSSGVYLYALIIMLSHMKGANKGGRIALWVLVIYGLCLGFGPVAGSTRYAFPIFMCAPFAALAGAYMKPKTKKAP